MKYLVFLMILGSVVQSNFAQAASGDYSCSVRQYRIALNLGDDPMGSSFFLSDDYGTIANAFASFVQVKGDNTVISFNPGNADPVKMTFNSEVLANKPDRLTGYIETKARGFLLWDYFKCQKIN